MEWIFKLKGSSKLFFLTLLGGLLIVSSCIKENNSDIKVYKSDLINPSLETLKEIHVLGYTVIDGSVLLEDLDYLNNLILLAKWKTINGSFEISNNSNLITLAGLNNLENINGNFFIYENERLTDFCAIRNLLSNGFNGRYGRSSNKFNPTEAEIKSGDCSQ